MSAFDKIFGYENEVEEVKKICDFFKNREQYEKLGATFPRGLLIYGEPGVGKTLLASCLIEESQVNSYILRNTSGNDAFIDEIKNVFEEARRNAPAIILLDDMDKFANVDENHQNAKEYVAIQAGIDSVKDDEILVVATVNDMMLLPDSLVRRGRFDRIILMEHLSKKDINNVIEQFLKTKSIDVDVSIEDFSKMIAYSSCADLEALLNEAAIEAAYKGHQKIKMEDLVKAVLNNEFFSYKVPDDDSDKELYKIALHEAGHVVVMESFRAGSVGYVALNSNFTKGIEGATFKCDELGRRPERVIEALAGKAAVEMKFSNTVASGCSSDLHKAYDLVINGLTRNATRGFGGCTGHDYRSEFPIGKRLEIEAMATAEMERSFMACKDILIRNKAFLDMVTSELVEKKVLLYSDIQRIRNSVDVYEHVA